MSDFFKIDTRPGKRGVTEIYPKFIVGKPNDLMIRGSDFYAIWMEERGLWSTDEQDVIRTIDRELRTYADEYQKTHDNGFHVLYMWDAESGMIDNWHKYCQRQMRDNFHPLDEVLIFSNTPVKKESYASKRLPYPLEPGSINAYDELMGVLYSPEEREKLEWAIGAVVNGASKEVQKFIVLYGDPGSGKSTVLNIVQKLFEGYCGVFDSRALGSSSNAFALEAFKSNPLVSIQHDGDLSRIEDNTRLNSLVSHETMLVNEKFKSQYPTRFNCFLFLGTNKAVKITDAKSGLIRRLIDVTPTGNKLPAKKYLDLVHKVNFELGGIHLHYIYTGDVTKLSRIYDENIEVKVFTGKSSLRRKLSKCNDISVASISSGLPLKGEKMVDAKQVQNERHLRILIKKALAKEISPYTKPNVDFIAHVMEEAYEGNVVYDVDDMRNAILLFAASSTNQADICVKTVAKMHFKSKEEAKSETDILEAPIAFFDCEVFPNLFLINWKLAGEDKPVHRMVNPTASEVEALTKYRLVGFNNRKYDNHMLWACMLGWTTEQLYALSNRIINEHTGFFGEAYNLSYTDIYDFSAKKQSLKKFEIELGIHHQELGLPWDQPVPKSLWDKVAEYCDNDVLATEAVFNARHADFVAREILADIAGLTVNDTTNTLTTRIIFGKEKHPKLVYTDLATGEQDALTEVEPDILVSKNIINSFPGYEWTKGDDGRMHNMFRGTDLGLGGYVYAEPGMYWNVALLDVASLHPHSAVAMNYFGEYTKNFNDLMDVRIYVKHKEYDKAKKLFGGKLAKYLDDPAQAKALAQALKIAINSVYGLTSATFDNPFRNPKNANNIVALRGALFMRTLQDEVQQRGFTVAHIKTDSIKIPGATPEIIDFCMKFAEKYGYQFEHEATYEKMCLVNNAVYIARYMDAADCKARYGYVPGDNEKEGGEWTATGTQFQVPYVFKTLFSHEDIVFNDLCETKSVSKGAIYLDKNENLAEGEHNYIFVGRVGQFCPIKPGCGGALLVREAGVKDNGETKYDSVTGAKDYRWLESEMVYNLHLEDTIDRSYFDKMATKAVEAISEYGDFEQFASNDLGESPWQKPDIPWDDVQDEAAQNFNVR